MADETEVERLVVRLVGDGSEYVKMLSQAQTQTLSAAKTIEDSAKRIEGFSSSITRFAQGAMQALGAVGLGFSLKGMFEGFSEREKSMNVLNALLKANGREVEGTLEQYKAFAKQMAAVTTESAGAVMGLLKMSEMMGLTGDQAKAATQQAIALAAATGVDAESAMRVTSALAQGDIERAQMMSRMILPLRGVRDQTEFVTKATALMTAGWEAAQKEAESAAGKLKQMENTISSLKKDFGEIIAVAIKPAIDWIKSLVDQFRLLDQATKEAVVGVMTITAAVLALGPAIAIIRGLFGPLIDMFKYLVITIPLMTVQIVLNTAVWVAWYTVLAIAKTVLFLFNTAIALTTFLLNAGVTVVTAVATGIVLFTVAVYGAAVALTLLVSLGSGVITALVGIANVIRGLGPTGDQLSGVTGIFMQWKGILTDIFKTMTVNMPLAWEMVKSAGALAVSQLRDLWPPLWNFIREGFSIVAKTAGELFVGEFERAKVHAMALVTRGTDEEHAAMVQELARLDESVARTRRLTLAAAGRDLQNLIDATSVSQSSATAQAVRDLEAIRSKIGAEGSTNSANPFAPILITAKAINAETNKLENALYRSAEGVSRIRAYLAQGTHLSQLPGAASSSQPVASGGQPSVNNLAPQQLSVLELINKGIQIIADRVQSNSGAQVFQYDVGAIN